MNDLREPRGFILEAGLDSESSGARGVGGVSGAGKKQSSAHS